MARKLDIVEEISFACRTRMAEFGENYRNGGDPVPCLICHLHLDNQVIALKYTIVGDNAVINGRYEEIVNGNINKERAKTLRNIFELGINISRNIKN